MRECIRDNGRIGY